MNSTILMIAEPSHQSDCMMRWRWFSSLWRGRLPAPSMPSSIASRSSSRSWSKSPPSTSRRTLRALPSHDEGGEGSGSSLTMSRSGWSGSVSSSSPRTSKTTSPMDSGDLSGDFCSKGRTSRMGFLVELGLASVVAHASEASASGFSKSGTLVVEVVGVGVGFCSDSVWYGQHVGFVPGSARPRPNQLPQRSYQPFIRPMESIVEQMGRATHRASHVSDVSARYRTAAAPRLEEIAMPITRAVEARHQKKAFAPVHWMLAAASFSASKKNMIQPPQTQVAPNKQLQITYRGARPKCKLTNMSKVRPPERNQPMVK
mmetsp:Transcript_21166/g.45909  ORF Transcript_21166/g.45909 Transcript_21166/m.45909 type:complete len:315 (-) Transcript_21166:1117-2061(-)